MCFSLAWLESILIWLIIIGATIALLRLLVRFVLPHLGLGGEVLSFVVQAITIVIWAIVCIAAVYFVFSLIACMGPSLPSVHPR